MQQWAIGIEPWGRVYFEKLGFKVTDQIVLRNLLIYIDKEKAVFFPVVEKDLMRERTLFHFGDVKKIIYKIKYEEPKGMPRIQKSWLIIETDKQRYRYMIAIESHPNLQAVVKSESEFGVSKLKAYLDGKILYGKREENMQVKGPIVLTKKKENIQNGMWLLYAGLAALLFSLMNVVFWGWGEQTKLIVMVIGVFGILATAWGTKWVLLTPLEKYILTEHSIRKYGMMSFKIIKYTQLRTQQKQEVAVWTKGILKINTPDEIFTISRRDYDPKELHKFIEAFEKYSKIKVIRED